MVQDVPCSEVEADGGAVGFAVGPGGGREEEQDGCVLEHQL